MAERLKAAGRFAKPLYDSKVIRGLVESLSFRILEIMKGILRHAESTIIVGALNIPYFTVNIRTSLKRILSLGKLISDVKFELILTHKVKICVQYLVL